MMKKSILSLFCLLLILSASAAAWPRKDVTNVVSFQFPNMPQQVTGVAGQINYVYQTDSCSYLVQAKPYTDDGKVYDSVTLAAFYEGVVKGVLKAAKGTLVKKDSIEISGLKGVEMEYVKGDERSLPVTIFSRALLVNGEVIIYSFNAPSTGYGRMTSLRDRFLASIKCNKDSTLTQYHPRSATDSIAAQARAAAMAQADTTVTASKATSVQTTFLDSHAGSVVKMFGFLILVCGLIYFFAVQSRRKG